MLLSATLALAFAQTTFLSEDFSSGSVPPTGWVELNNGNSLCWEAGSTTSQDAWHDDFSGWNDNSLVSPQVDLSSATLVGLHFDQNVAFASWRDHHYINVSLDNGITFITVKDELSGDGQSAVDIDLSNYAGVSGLNISFQYTGDYASEWSIDNILLDDSNLPPPPTILTTAVNPANGHTYHLLEQLSWTAGEAAAVQLGGHLATVRSQSENDWILQQFGNWNGQDRDLWIGLNDVAVEGNFEWTSGEAVTFTNWAPGQPDNNGATGEQYTHLYGANSPYGSGQWNDMFDASSTSWSPGYFAVVELGGGVPYMTVNNLVAAQTATINFDNCTPSGIIYFVWSSTGGGPIQTAFGTGYVSHPLHITPLAANGNGQGSLSIPVPATASGLQIWMHGLDHTSGIMLNALALVVG